MRNHDHLFVPGRASLDAAIQKAWQCSSLVWALGCISSGRLAGCRRAYSRRVGRRGRSLRVSESSQRMALRSAGRGRFGPWLPGSVSHRRFGRRSSDRAAGILGEPTEDPPRLRKSSGVDGCSSRDGASGFFLQDFCSVGRGVRNALALLFLCHLRRPAGSLCGAGGPHGDLRRPDRRSL